MRCVEVRIVGGSFHLSLQTIDSDLCSASLKLMHRYSEVM